MDLNKLPQNYGLEWVGELRKDNKLICRVSTYNAPFQLPKVLNVRDMPKCLAYLSALPTIQLFPIFAGSDRNIYEWKRFRDFLFGYSKVAIIHMNEWQLAVLPPKEEPLHNGDPVIVCYCRLTSLHSGFVGEVVDSPRYIASKAQRLASEKIQTQSPHTLIESKSARTHPSYLETLSHTHGWIFGALAELIDNARDAGARRLDIMVEEGVLPDGTTMPMLCVMDNGRGMMHAEIFGMLSFGHKRPEEDDVKNIGRFGVGFKTGTMRLGKDVVVLTQNKETRSIAFFSATFNKNKEVLEIPICTYRKRAGRMDFDLEVHGKAEAEANLQAVRELSPFNEYKIGEKFGKFGENGTGTFIYIYNMDKWGSDYSLKWDEYSVHTGGAQEIHDICVRNRRMRSRPGQMSQDVPLDYSLHAYLEVMFLDPRMQIYIQGTKVKSRPLAKSLKNTEVVKGMVMNKEVKLTLGCNQQESERGNCGIFLYWHGRLIEAYKRVGGMIHNPDMGRGVIGVTDVTDIMNLGNGMVAVLNNKQGFQDCEAYVALETWLGQKADEYWDIYYDSIQLHQKKEQCIYEPDMDWVQCNKCLKWRMIHPKWNFASEELPEEWFCYMHPFKGSCQDPEEKTEGNVVTLGVKRSNHLPAVKEDKCSEVILRAPIGDQPGEDEGSDNINTIDSKKPPYKRLVKGLAESMDINEEHIKKKPRK